MPIATPEVYAQMLDAAKEKSFAYPAINVSSSQTLNAALKGFADAGSDGIVQVSTGGAEYLSGPSVKDMVTGSVAFAAYAAEVAKNYPVNIALHTDHCPQGKLDGFVRPLLDISAERVARGEAPLFQSHMWDGSAVPLDENLQIAEELLAKCAAANVILEIEVGVVGGEEDGVANEINDQLYTTPEDAHRHDQGARRRRARSLHDRPDLRQRARRLQARQRQAASRDPQVRPGGRCLGARPRSDARPFDLVFHGGSGSTAQEISDAVDFGVVKMNVDTDTQYAFTRPVAAHMFANYDGVLKVDGEVGNKNAVRPPRLGQGRRGRHGRAHRRGLPEPPLRRDVARRLTRPCRAGPPGNGSKRTLPPPPVGAGVLFSARYRPAQGRGPGRDRRQPVRTRTERGRR